MIRIQYIFLPHLEAIVQIVVVYILSPKCDYSLLPNIVIIVIFILLFYNMKSKFNIYNDKY